MSLTLLTIIMYIAVANGQVRKVIELRLRHKGDKQKNTTDMTTWVGGRTRIRGRPGNKRVS